MSSLASVRRAARARLGGRRALVVVAAVAVAVRLPLGLLAPPFVDVDTPQYLQRAFALLADGDLGADLRRAPGYPAFLAAAMWLLGADFPRILLLQHAMGIGIALLTADLGTRLYGARAGLAAGLITALSAPLLLAEHTLLTETLFGLLVVAGCWLALRALAPDRERWGPWFVVGLLFGLAALVRPVGQFLLPLPAIVCLLAGGGWRRSLRVAVLVAAGGALALCPWMAYNLARHGVFTLTHVTGETLITHTAVYGRGLYTLPPAGGTEDPARTVARRIVQEASGGAAAKARRVYGPRIAEAVRRETGLSPVAADNLLRELALEQIRARPMVYLRLLGGSAWQIFAGRPADLRYAWETPASQSWGRSLPAHPRPASDEQDRWIEPLKGLLRLYDPAPLAAPIAVLFALGALGAVLEPRARPALLPTLAAITLVLLAAGLVGGQYRYRYPADPLITVVALGGLRGLGRHLTARGRSLLDGRDRGRAASVTTAASALR